MEEDSWYKDGSKRGFEDGLKANKKWEKRFNMIKKNLKKIINFIILLI